MRENLHRFFRAARGAGVKLSPAESIDAMRAVSKVGFADRTILRDTFLLTLAKTQDEKKALQYAGKVFLELSAENLVKALQAGVLLEVCCDKQDH